MQLGQIRALAKKISADHELGLELWKTGNLDARLLAELIDRIEGEMAGADPMAQWTMHMALAEIGIHHPKLRKRALTIGERLGVDRDYPVSKGCTSPFAPSWIGEMVKR